MSHTKMFVRTLVPPSPHTQAAGDSNAQLLRRSTLVVAQGARCGRRRQWSATPTSANRRRGKRSLREKEHAERVRQISAFRSEGKVVTLCWPTDLVCVMVPHTWCHHRCFRLPYVEGYAAGCQQMPLEKVVHFSPTFSSLHTIYRSLK